MTIRLHIKVAATAAVIFSTACAPEQNTPPQNVVEQDVARREAAGQDRISWAVESAARFAEDRTDDPMRQPEKVLGFIGVEPGMTVFEMEAGVGYYTELFSELVGPDGEVVMQSPPSFDSFLGEGIEKRLYGGRLGNVRLSKTAFDHLDAEDGSADIVTWMLGPHELYFTPSDGADLGGVEQTYAEIYRILKPGGFFIVLDHAAAPGAPETTGGALHRIDSAIVKSNAAAAGFTLVKESDILRNPNDDYSMSVFDPAVRRKTDRFLLKFQKAE